MSEKKKKNCRSHVRKRKRKRFVTRFECGDTLCSCFLRSGGGGREGWGSSKPFENRPDDREGKIRRALISDTVCAVSLLYPTRGTYDKIFWGSESSFECREGEKKNPTSYVPNTRRIHIFTIIYSALFKHPGLARFRICQRILRLKCSLYTL